MITNPNRRIECFFDCSSPWTYLGFLSLRDISRRTGVAVDWKPIVVGGVFNQVNQAIYRERDEPSVPAKKRYHDKDLQDWARHAGVAIGFPPACGHPVNSVRVMRACLVAQDLGALEPFALAAFEALWREGLDVGKPEVIASLATATGLDAAWLLETIESPEIKQRLRANGDDLVARGGYGSPTIFIDGGDMFFGNDRMVLIERALTVSS